MSLQIETPNVLATAHPLTLARVLAMAALVAIALGLGWKSWEVNTTMACWKDEWPQLAMCQEIMGRTPAEQIARLQTRLAKNPGDSQALVALAAWARKPEGVAAQLNAPALLAAAIEAAPQNNTVLRMQANDALRDQQWPLALDTVGRLSRYHGEADAAQSLAILISQSGGSPPLMSALMAATRTEAGWIDSVLRAMPQAKLPVASAVPLINELMASGKMEPALGQYVIRELKREGLWMEAHAVWRHLWRRDLPLVFNGEFEQAFVRDGFDWVVADANNHHSGARVDLVGRKDHGLVLQVAFTGKAILPPVLRQDMLLFPGRYLLRGSVQSTDLRSEQGLAWVVTCAQDGRELGRSAALKTTGRAWQAWEAEITMPGDCTGFGARLALQTFAPYEAKTGLRGEVLMDGITMARNNELQ